MRHYYRVDRMHKRDLATMLAEGSSIVSAAADFFPRWFGVETGQPGDAHAFIADVLMHGDYVGTGAVARSNIRVLERDFAALEGHVWAHCRSSYGYRAMMVDARLEDGIDAFPCSPEFLTEGLEQGRGDDTIREEWRELVQTFKEAVDGLEDYPLVSDDDHSDLEAEEEAEAWERDGYRDLAREVRCTFGSAGAETVDGADDFDADDAKELLMLVSPEFTGSEVEHQPGGCYIDASRIVERHVTASDVVDAMKLAREKRNAAE